MLCYVMLYNMCHVMLYDMCHVLLYNMCHVRDGPLENLWGGGQSTKKYSRKGKLNEKNSCTPINPKKYSCYGLKKIHTRNLITKKNSCCSKIPLPPITFLMVRPLCYITCVMLYNICYVMSRYITYVMLYNTS